VTAAVQTAAASRSRRRTAWAAALDVWLAAELQSLILFAPVALGGGIAAWFILPGAPGWLAAICAGLAVAVAGCLASGLARIAVVAAGLLFVSGVALVWLRAEAVTAPVISGRYVGIIAGRVSVVESLPARGRTRIIVKVGEADPLLAGGLKARITLSDVPVGLAAGDRVRLRAALSPPALPNVPGGYHFARKSWFEGVGAVGFALSPTERAAAATTTGWQEWLDNFRQRLTKLLQTGVGGSAGGLAAALVTGDRGGIEEAVTNDMRDSGLAHLISISGLHIAVVVSGVLFGLRRVMAMFPWIALRVDIKAVAAILAAAVGIAYTLVAGASVPTIRSCIAVLVVLLGLLVGREAISLRMIAAGAFLILIVRPEYLLSPSFQLSFAAVTAIVALYQSPAGRHFSARGQDAGYGARLWRGVIALIATGLVAEAALAPIAFFHFQQMGLYGVLANLVAIPLTSFIILPLLALALLLAPFGIAEPCYWLLDLAIGALIDVSHVTASLPGAVARYPAMPVTAFAFIMAGGLWLCLWQTRRRLFGLPLIAIGLAGALFARAPDVIVDGKGRHLALVDNGTMRLLRPRAGSYVRDMWQAAAGLRTSGDLDDRADTVCGPDACMAVIRRGGRDWSLLATRSSYHIDRSVMEQACLSADIVVSDRHLPRWCKPRWLMLDQRTLNQTGALAIWLSPLRIETVTAGDGAHPWAAVRRSQ
jgi:competence protein ComEC